MNNLKYTKKEDIQTFLETIGYRWFGNMPKNSTQTFEDITNGVLVILCEKDNILSALNIRVSDTSFLVEDENSKKKCGFIDHSLNWQLFMLKRKGKSYAKLLYAESLKSNHETKEQYDKKINLLIKRAEELSNDRNLKISNTNTALLNAASKLSETEIEKLNAEYSANN